MKASGGCLCGALRYEIDGKRKVFSRPGDRGSDVNRTFCPSCGSTVFGNPLVMGDMRIVGLGTLDDSSGIEMQMAVYCSRAQNWDKVAEGLMTFPEMPTQG